MYRVLNKKMNDTFLVKNFNDKFNPKKKKIHLSTRLEAEVRTQIQQLDS